VNPDGAELYLTTPALLRSSVRAWPDSEEEFAEFPGLRREDVNGDGKILQMRVRDDNKGEWKASKKDVRLMIPRRPGERKGPFYRVYPEGTIKDFEGEPFDQHRGPFGLTSTATSRQTGIPRSPEAATSQQASPRPGRSSSSY
jgi:murein tripeptide amidase MpaA